MTDGLFKKLSPEQQAAALAFDGNPDFGPPMTDLTLTQAIAELQQATYDEPWTAEMLMEYGFTREGGTFLAAILNAVVSGDLIPLADAKRAVAGAYRKAASLPLTVIPYSPEQKALLGALTAYRDTILALADTDALAELQALRDSADESEGNLLHALHQLDQAKAELAATRAKLARVVEAAEALGAMPEGYCFCSQNRIGDESKTHEPECRDFRLLLQKIKG